MTVFTHVAPRPDPLVALLCEQLAEPPDDLFERAVVAVPTRGIERWLTQQIAVGFAERGVGDGICANVDFPSPSGRAGVENALDLCDLGIGEANIPAIPPIGEGRAESLARWADRMWADSASRAEVSKREHARLEALIESAASDHQAELDGIRDEATRRRESG
jgi:hypothetical protein